MRDPRIDEYARLLVDRSVGVQPGWQVLVRGDAARAAAGRGGARADRAARRLPDPPARVGARSAARSRARRRSSCCASRRRCSARSGRSATRSSRSRRPRTSATARTSRTSGGRAAAADRAAARAADGDGRPWVICEYPTQRLAQEAGMTLDGVRGVRLRRRAPRLGCRRPSGCARIADVFDAADEVRIVGGRDRPDALARRPRTARSTTGTSTCRAARSSTRRSRTRPRAWSTFSEFPAVYFGHEVGASGSSSRAARSSRHGARSGEDVPARDARHRRGRPPARRARDRLQPGHPAVHEERRLRREDRRHGPPRGRQLLLVHRRHERQRDPLGHGQGPADRRPSTRRRARAGERPLAPLARPRRSRPRAARCRRSGRGSRRACGRRSRGGGTTRTNGVTAWPCTPVGRRLGERLLDQRLDVVEALVRRAAEQEPAAAELPVRRARSAAASPADSTRAETGGPPRAA